MNRAALIEALISSTPGQHGGLIGHDAHRGTAQPGEPHHDVVRIAPLHFQEHPIVHDPADDAVHVVGLVGGIGDQLEQRLVAPFDRVAGGALGWLVQIVERKESDQLADGPDALGLRIVHEVGDSRGLAVSIGPAQVVEADLLMGDGLHHAGAGHEHVAHAPDHEDEIGDGGAIHRPAGAGPQDGGNLRDHARTRGCCGGRCRRSRRARPLPPGSGPRPSR